MKDDTISATEAGRIIGCHRTEVSRLSQPGGVLEHALVEPGAGRKAARYSRPAVEVYAAALREQRPLDPQQERARRDAAAADLAELKVKTARRDYLPREEVERQLAGEWGAVKSILLSWSTTLVDKLHRAKTVEGITGLERTVDSAVREVLTELSDPERPIACPRCGFDLAAPDEQDPRCRARTSKGDRCKNPAGEDGYCHVPSHRRPN